MYHESNLLRTSLKKFYNEVLHQSLTFLKTKFLLFDKKSNIFQDNQALSIIQQFTKYESNLSRTFLKISLCQSFTSKFLFFSKKSNILKENYSSMFLARPQAPSIMQQFSMYESNLSRTSLKKVYNKV